MALKNNEAWEIAQAKVKEIPPVLSPDELTAHRYAEKNHISLYRAKRILNGLVRDGILTEEARRRPEAGGHEVTAYVIRKGK